MKVIPKTMKTVIVFQLFLLSFFVSLNSTAQWVYTDSVDGPVKNISTSGNNLYVCSGWSGVYISSDSGFTFTSSNNGLGNLCTRTIAARDSLIILGTVNSVYKSINYGNSWILASNGLPPPSENIEVRDIIFKGDSVILASWGAGIYCSLDFCQTWFPINNGLSGYNKQCLFNNGNRIFVGSTYEAPLMGGIHVSDDNGSTWIPKNSGVPMMYPTQYVVISDIAKTGQFLFASTEGRYVLRSENNGEAWITLHNSNEYVPCLFSYSNTLLCGNGYLGITKSDDYGITWSFINEGLQTIFDKDIRTFCRFGSYIYIGTGSNKVFRRPIEEIVTEINEFHNRINAIVYPNPISYQSTIAIPNSPGEKYSLEVFNEVGVSVYQYHALEFNQLILRQNEYRHGLYIFRITGSKQGLFCGKFFVN
jgi:hypothetical protein